MVMAYSNQIPARYEILHAPGDDMCTVTFYTNVRAETMRDGDIMYTAQIIRVSVQYVTDILQDVRDNYTEWLKMATEDLVTKNEEV